MANTKIQTGKSFAQVFTPLVSGDFSYAIAFAEMLTPEAESNYRLGVAGTFSRLGFEQSAATGTATIQFRKNTGNGNQVKLSTANTAAWFEDTVNTDVVAKDDIIDIAWTGTATLPTIGAVKVLFDASPSLVNLLGNSGIQIFQTHGALFFPLLCKGRDYSVAAGGTESDQQHRIRAPGTLSYFQVAGRGDVTTPFTLLTRINGNNGNSTLSVPASLSGLLVDTTHTDTLADGDMVCVATTLAGNDSWTLCMGSCLTQSAGTYDWGGFNGAARAASATNNFYTPKGKDATPATSEVIFPISYNNTGQGFKRARINVSANTYGADVVWQFRKNAINANNACTITAGVTGWFEDVTHTDTFVDGDSLDYLLTGGTSGSLTIQGYVITIDNGTGGPTTIFSFDQIDTGFSRRLENIGY